MKQDEEYESKDCIEVARNMWNCIKGGEEYIEEMCKKYKTMRQEQYERAAEIQTELKKLKKFVDHLGYDNAFVEVHVQGIAGFDEIRDNGLKNCMTDYLSCRIAELEKEFEEL